MNQIEEKIRQACAYIDKYESSMIKLWQNLVSIESPSADREANERIASHLDTYCDAIGMDREIYHFEKAGPTFAAWTQPQEKKPIALLGHYDTVHPVASFGPDPFVIDGDEVHGPGVFDMKGGIVIELFAIRALQAIGYSERQIKLLLSGDEEVAHAFSVGESGRLMEEHVEGCAAVFNCESGADNAEVTLTRKGGAIFNIKVYGKAAHAGREPEKGASAIRQAAYMINEIEKHTVFGDLTFNCGRIKGGSGANIIPDYCEFAMAIRYCTNEQYHQAARMIQDFCDHPIVAGTHCSMEQNGFYPAMEILPKTAALFASYQKAAELLGCPIPVGISQGGCSDSSFATRIGVPSLCSLGVQGRDNHQKSETAIISSLALQCKKLIAAILLLPEDF